MIDNTIIRELSKTTKYLSKKIQIEPVYKYRGKPVPRVTTILSAMLHEDYLMDWSNKLGMHHVEYKAFLDVASNKGTYTHQAIEELLLKNKDPDMDEIPEMARKTVKNTLMGFKIWWDTINRYNTVEILAIEKPLVCKYFGGTLDCLMKINDKIWLVDFKSSNHLSYKYMLQVSAYSYMLKELEGINVDGYLVLRLNKYRPIYEENVIDSNNKNDKEFIDMCLSTFLSLVNSYYKRLQVEYLYDQKFGNDTDGKQNEGKK